MAEEMLEADRNPPDDGKRRAEEAAGFLAKLEAAKDTLIAWGLEDAYEVARNFLRSDAHSKVRSRGWSNAELYACRVPNPGQKSIVVLGAVPRMHRSARYKRTERELIITTIYMPTETDGTFNEREDRTSRRPIDSASGLILLWDLPPPAAKVSLDSFDNDMVSDLTPAVAERHALLRAIECEPTGGEHDSVCQTCRFYVPAGQTGLGHCLSGPPDPANARYLADRLNRSLSVIPISAQFPIIKGDHRACGAHSTKEPANGDAI